MASWDKFFQQNLTHLIHRSHLILDIGGGPGLQKQLSPHGRSLSSKAYFSIDFNIQTQPQLVGDIHHLPIRSQSADAVICKAVLEHAQNPHQAVSELHRTLKKNGHALIYAPFLYPYHGNPKYKDYYRFTQDGLVELFKRWNHLKIHPIRGYCETLTNLLPPPLPIITRPLARLLDKLKITHQSSGYYLHAIK